jgi:hypothetical protein
MGIKPLQEFTVAFYKSKAWTDLAPQRDKAIGRYLVEAEKQRHLRAGAAID